MKADFKINYTDMKKKKRERKENPNFLSFLLRSHIADNYSIIWNLYRSVLENEQASAGFDIPEFKPETAST